MFLWHYYKLFNDLIYDCKKKYNFVCISDNIYGTENNFYGINMSGIGTPGIENSRTMNNCRDYNTKSSLTRHQIYHDSSLSESLSESTTQASESSPKQPQLLYLYQRRRASQPPTQLRYCLKLFVSFLFFLFSTI